MSYSNNMYFNVYPNQLEHYTHICMANYCITHYIQIVSTTFLFYITGYIFHLKTSYIFID